MNQGISRLAKLLASDELKNRKIGYKYARELMKLHPGSDNLEISYIDILGVCKGLYYSLWMQDKPLLQEEAVARIVKLIDITKNRVVRSMYVKGMFDTLAKEWEGLDFWRQDKFMMLVRDFLVRCIVSVKRRALGPEVVTSAIFDSILNCDINSAVDLKLHLIFVLKEELSKAGEVPSLINAFFKHALECVQKMPRGSAYTTDMVILLNFLAKKMRKYSKFPFGKISEELLVLSTKFPLYRRTFLRISKILHVKEPQVNVKAEKKSTAGSNIGESRTSSVKDSQLNGKVKKCVVVSQNVESEILAAKKPQVNGDKRKYAPQFSKVDSMEVFGNISKSQNLRKRKLTEDDAPTPNEENVSKSKRPKGDSYQGKGNVPKTESIPKQPVEVDVAPKEKNDAAVVTDSVSFKDPDFNVLTAPTNLLQMDMSVLDSLGEVTQSKRVSFGKVFCKKFSSTKRLTDRPISIPTPPNRGILRR